MRALVAISLVSAAIAGGSGSPERLALLARPSDVPAPRSARLSAVRYDVGLDTSKGPIVIAVHHDWAPHGADRFHELVTSRYFESSLFCRVVTVQWAQFGIAGAAALATAWRPRTIPDDPRGPSNTR